MSQASTNCGVQGQTIIFTSREPSLPVTYNSERDSHAVFRVRRVSQFQAGTAMPVLYKLPWPWIGDEKKDASYTALHAIQDAIKS